MRKEVKLGFAIGGILLAVLFVYMMAVSGDSSPQDPVTLATNDASAPVTASPTPAPAVHEAPVVSAGPIDVPAFSPGNQTQRDPFAAAPALANPTSPTTAPAPVEAAPVTETPVASASPAEDRWVVLHTGLPETTQTPKPTPAARNSNSGGSSSPIAPAISGNAVSLNNPTTRSSGQTSAGSSTGQRTHTVAAGETFSSISAAAYGSASYFSHIMRANPNINPAKLKPGMVIVLPADDEVKAVAPAGATARTQAQQTPVDSKTEYRVENGDSLYKISMKLYGKPDRLEKLYDLNKATIGADKTRLSAGMVLKLPEAPTAR